MNHEFSETICYGPAGKRHARAIAELMNVAGEGIPLALWSGDAPGAGDPLDVGARKAARDDANFSYANAQVAVVGDRVAGMALAYRLDEPTSGDSAALADIPELVRPMVELEREVGGSYYINALAVREGFRGRGIGTRLLRLLAPLARDAGCSLMSVGVFAENTDALRLYRREGFRVAAERPLIAHPCYTRTDRTLMLVKPL